MVPSNFPVPRIKYLLCKGTGSKQVGCNYSVCWGAVCCLIIGYHTAWFLWRKYLHFENGRWYRGFFLNWIFWQPWYMGPTPWNPQCPVHLYWNCTCMVNTYLAGHGVAWHGGRTVWSLVVFRVLVHTQEGLHELHGVPYQILSMHRASRESYFQKQSWISLLIKC